MSASEKHKVLRLPRKLRFEVHLALHLPRNLHFEVHKVLCACHEICTLRFTKRCACHEICIARFTTRCACREICTSSFTKCAPPVTKSRFEVHKVLCLPRNLRGRSPPCPKRCTCHEICISKQNRSDPLHLSQKVDFGPPTHEVSLAPATKSDHVRK